LGTTKRKGGSKEPILEKCTERKKFKNKGANGLGDRAGYDGKKKGSKKDKGRNLKIRYPNDIKSIKGQTLEENGRANEKTHAPNGGSLHENCGGHS